MDDTMLAKLDLIGDTLADEGRVHMAEIVHAAVEALPSSEDVWELARYRGLVEKAESLFTALTVEEDDCGRPRLMMNPDVGSACPNWPKYAERIGAWLEELADGGP
jgi:hypothetical protein